MLYPYVQPDFLGLLRAQQAYYISELGNTHKALSKQYKKLAYIELAIAERHERQLTRKDKKKLQWSRALTKKTIRDLESQQARLQDYLRRCNDLVAFSDEIIFAATPTTWMGHVPLSPYPVSPYPMSSTSLWPVPTQDPDPAPQYWDLSMLPETRPISPAAPSADSGFYEPPMQASERSIIAPAMTCSRQNSACSENDDVSSLPIPGSPKTTGADPISPIRRRFSENAIQLIESRLAAPKVHNRVRSVEQFPAFEG